MSWFEITAAADPAGHGFCAAVRPSRTGCAVGAISRARARPSANSDARNSGRPMACGLWARQNITLIGPRSDGPERLRAAACQPPLPAAVGVHHVDLRAIGALYDENDPPPVRRQVWGVRGIAPRRDGAGQV